MLGRLEPYDGKLSRTVLRGLAPGNWGWLLDTHSAEFKNAENLVFIKSQDVAKKYTIYFEGRWKVSKSVSSQKTLGKPK